MLNTKPWKYCKKIYTLTYLQYIHCVHCTAEQVYVTLSLQRIPSETYIRQIKMRKNIKSKETCDIWQREVRIIIYMSNMRKEKCVYVCGKERCVHYIWQRNLRTFAGLERFGAANFPARSRRLEKANLNKGASKKIMITPTANKQPPK